MQRRKPLKRSPIARKSRPKPRNDARRKREFARAYGSVERVAFVASLPCIVTAAWASAHEGPTDNHHTKTGGTGRKGDARVIVPLCRKHHSVLHNHGDGFFEDTYALDLAAEAARIDALWQAHRAGA